MDAFADTESKRVVLSLNIVIERAEGIPVNSCAVDLDPAGWLVVKVVLVYLLLKVGVMVSMTGEVRYVGVDASFPSTSTTEYDALVRTTGYSPRLWKSRGNEQDCNVSAKIRKGLRKCIRSTNTSRQGNSFEPEVRSSI